MTRIARSTRAFTLLELLVVIALIAVLVGMLLPTLGAAKDQARKALCLSNVKQIGVGIYAYAGENNYCIPFGPKAPPIMSAADFYPSTGAPTSLISLMNGDPVGLGLLLPKQLSRDPRVLFCPGRDQKGNAGVELAKVGISQAQCSYYYRHASVVKQFDSGSDVLTPEHVRLENLGLNRNGRPIRALVLDTQFLCSSGFASFGVTPSTHHRRQCVSTLFSDGHAAQLSNADGLMNVNLDSYQAMTNAFDLILDVLEHADASR